MLLGSSLRNVVRKARPESMQPGYAAPASPPGLFGRKPGVQRGVTGNGQMPALPGPISGFGGGTFNLDGSVATPVQPPLESDPAPAGRMGLPAPPPEPQRAQGPLGHSMREPFDYDAALQTLAGKQKKIKDWQWIAAGLAGALGAPQGMQALAQRRDAQRERMQDAQKTVLGWRYDDWARQNAADLRAADPTTIGRNLVQFDPRTGQPSVVYDGEEDFELYAAELGLEPGTQEYFDAVEDYVLRSNGPSAYERDLGLDDHRTANDERLEGVRQGNRVSMETLRQRNRNSSEGVRQRNRIQVRTTPPARSAGGHSSTRPTATDGRGNKVEWNGSAWVPAR